MKYTHEITAVAVPKTSAVTNTTFRQIMQEMHSSPIKQLRRAQRKKLYPMSMLRKIRKYRRNPYPSQKQKQIIRKKQYVSSHKKATLKKAALQGKACCGACFHVLSAALNLMICFFLGLSFCFCKAEAVIAKTARMKWYLFLPSYSSPDSEGSVMV